MRTTHWRPYMAGDGRYYWQEVVSGLPARPGVGDAAIRAFRYATDHRN